jgi:hypothetical protein
LHSEDQRKFTQLGTPKRCTTEFPCTALHCAALLSRRTDCLHLSRMQTRIVVSNLQWYGLSINSISENQRASQARRYHVKLP